MKIILLIILLGFSMFCYSQATATATCTVTIIAIEDTSKYYVKQSLVLEQELIEDTIMVGDTKSYLLRTFEQPDIKIIMLNNNDKQVWTYGNLIVYINDGIVESTRIIKDYE